MLAGMQAGEAQLEGLAALFARGAVAVLTGAGISTESGIPDYRGPETRRRARNPIQFRDFLHRPEARLRYWARSMIGWPKFMHARPNRGHTALHALEQEGRLSGLITQNVDGLHTDAGSRSVVELHGSLREVVCLACGTLHERAWLQRELEARNPNFGDAELAPDGDADVEDERLERFELVHCTCGGALKPHVVFFGENVPRPRVDTAMEILSGARALLVVGSSLAVYSGLRFVHAAKKREIPVAILTLGTTRGDPDASLRIDARAGDTLTQLHALLSAPR
ncbi:MAG TPA: NAD-dependent protein deacetylase [Polyangiales bacterium]|nr:NAD-dependent protein deacetylase [Polyangiales bacterium]